MRSHSQSGKTSSGGTCSLKGFKTKYRLKRLKYSKFTTMLTVTWNTNKTSSQGNSVHKLGCLSLRIPCGKISTKKSMRSISTTKLQTLVKNLSQAKQWPQRLFSQKKCSMCSHSQTKCFQAKKVTASTSISTNTTSTSVTSKSSSSLIWLKQTTIYHGCRTFKSSLWCLFTSSKAHNTFITLNSYPTTLKTSSKEWTLWLTGNGSVSRRTKCSSRNGSQNRSMAGKNSSLGFKERSLSLKTLCFAAFATKLSWMKMSSISIRKVNDISRL